MFPDGQALARSSRLAGQSLEFPCLVPSIERSGSRAAPNQPIPNEKLYHGSSRGVPLRRLRPKTRLPHPRQGNDGRHPGTGDTKETNNTTVVTPPATDTKENNNTIVTTPSSEAKSDPPARRPPRRARRIAPAPRRPRPSKSGALYENSTSRARLSPCAAFSRPGVALSDCGATRACRISPARAVHPLAIPPPRGPVPSLFRPQVPARASAKIVPQPRHLETSLVQQPQRASVAAPPPRFCAHSPADRTRLD